MSPVEAALNYADYCNSRGKITGGRDIWACSFPNPSEGDKVIGVKRDGITGSRPDVCMRILAAEVRWLRTLQEIRALGI